MDPELSALASAAATTLVQLLATAAWEQAKDVVGGLWRRAHPERVEAVEAELENTRTSVVTARQAGDEQVEQHLVAEWCAQLRHLVAAHPQLGDDLRRVVAELDAVQPDTAQPQATTIAMRATASGASRVYQAGHDLHITAGE